MIRTQFLVPCALALALAAPAAHAVTGTISIGHEIDGDTSKLTMVSGDGVALNVSYTVTNLGGDSAHVEVDICSPSYGFDLDSQGNVVTLSTCRTELGQAGSQAQTPPIVAAGSSQGTTGLFSLDAYTEGGFILDGTQWTIPARLILNSTGAVLASDSIVITISAAPTYSLAKTFYAVSAANQPGTTDVPGYNVSWLVAPQNEANNYGVVYGAGTTTVSDPVPAGAIYVSGNFVAGSLGQNYSFGGSTVAADHLNSGLSITSPGTAPSNVTNVAMTINNLLSESTAVAPQWLVTYWYPESTTTASNTATATFPDGSQQSATATIYLGEASGSISKTHLCPGIFPNGFYHVYSTLTAFSPNAVPSENPECAWDPAAPVQYKVDVSSVQPAGAPSPGTAMPMLNPVITDVIPPNMVLSSLDGIFADNDPYFGTDITSQWQISGSTDGSCGPSAGSFSPIALPASRASLASIRCVRYSYAGFSSAANFHYSANLDSTDQATLDATTGSYEFVTNNAYVNADNFGSDYTVSLQSTFWNAHEPAIYFTGPGNATIGEQFVVYGVVPALGTSLVNNYLGFDDLTFGGTLPAQIDLTGAPTLTPASEGGTLPVDDNGDPVTPICSYTPQDRTVDPIVLATWTCTIPGHIPSFTTDPYSTAGCVPPYYCTNTGGSAPWNDFTFNLPEVLVAGTQNQTISVAGSVWSNDGTIAPPAIVPAGSSASNPVYGYYNFYVEGTSQLTVTKSTPSISVETGHTINYFINYSNTGSTTTTNTYVYDLFGMNPTTGDSLSQDFSSEGCSATVAPTLVAVSHVSGTPGSVLEYTTVANPTLDNTAGTWTTWSTTPPADVSTVTGVRFFLNSAFSGNPGDYSPSDQAGEEEITLQAPTEIGDKLCNMAAIGADGFAVAGALAVGGAVPITPVCTQQGGCDPTSVPGPNATVDVGASCGAVSVPLDGSASANAVSYSWSENGNVLSTIAKPTLSLALGTHTITLSVTNSFGVTASNNVVITVADATPPQIVCPASVVATVDGACNPSYTVSPTASDICDPSATGLQPAVSCVTPALTAGQTGTTATCKATDSAGLSSSTCTIPVTVDYSNCAPIIEVSGTQTVSVTNTCGPPSVTLGYVTESGAVSFTYMEGTTILSTDRFPTVSLALGAHQITVTVANALGQTASATYEVDVVDPDGPTITCQSITVTAGSSCNATYSLSPTVSDICDPSVSGDPVQVSCEDFGALPIGQNNIPCTATNSSGQSSTCYSQVNVVAGASSGGSLTLGALSGQAGGAGAFCNSAPLTASFSLTGGCSGLTEYPNQPQFTATYLDSNNQAQSLNVTPTFDENSESSAEADGTLSISGIAGINQDAQITITAIDPNNGNAVLATTTADATLQTCNCSAASFSVGIASGSAVSNDGSSICGSSQIAVPFTLNLPCGETPAYDYLFFNVAYTGPGTTGTENISGFGYYNSDEDQYPYLPNTPNGTFYFNAPLDVTGSTVFTVTALADDGVTGIGTSTFSAPISQTCDSAVCVPDGMVMFEDNWPANGDLDFNDQTVAYNYQFLQQGDGVTVDQMLATFNILSVGANYHNGVYLHLPIPSTANVTITLYNNVNSNTVNVTPIAVGTEPDMIIPIVDDTRSLFPGVDGFINTDPNLPAVQGTVLSLLVTFNDSTSNQLDVSAAPFDVFIARTGDFGHQIHMAQYPGTKSATFNLFDSVNDNTNLTSGPYYVNASGLPFALNLPNYDPWAQEKVSIGNVYPQLASFFSTAGQPADWYDDTDYDQAYEQGAPVPGDPYDNPTYPPYPVQFMPPLSGAAGSCEASDFGGGISTGGGGDDGRGVHHHR